MPPAKKVAAKKAAPPAKKAAAPAKKAAPAAKKAAPGSRKPPQIVPVGEGSAERVKALFYGEPGTGKTTLCGTAPNGLMLEADLGGDASAALRGSTVEKWSLTDWNDQAEALGYLQHGGARQYDFVMLDTATMFQDSGLVNIMDDLVVAKPNRKVWLPDKGEYGQNMNRLLRFIRDLVALPTNVIVTAHILESTDHEGESRFMPFFQGKNMPDKVCAYFGVVGHMHMIEREGKEIARLSTKKEGKYYSKDRYGTIGAIVDPTIPKIMARIEKARQG